MKFLLFTLACMFLIFAVLFIKESLDYDEISMRIIGVFCILFFLSTAFALYSNLSEESCRKRETECYIDVEDPTVSTITIDHSGTYTIIGKDLEDDFVFVLEDKSGNYYIVTVKRKDYSKFEIGDKLTCAFTEKISRGNGDTLGCSNFEVFDME